MAGKATPRKRTTPEANNRRKSTRRKKTTNDKHTNRTVQKTTVVMAEKETETKSITKEFRSDVIVISSSCQSNPNNSGKDEPEGYDSTASTPIADRANVIKKVAQTERRASKSRSKLNMDDLAKSAPPVLNKSKRKFEMPEGFECNRIKKILLCKPEEDDDHDFYLNYQPTKTCGYDCVFNDLKIPEVSYIKYVSH